MLLVEEGGRVFDEEMQICREDNMTMLADGFFLEFVLWPI